MGRNILRPPLPSHAAAASTAFAQTIRKRIMNQQRKEMPSRTASAPRPMIQKHGAFSNKGAMRVWRQFPPSPLVAPTRGTPSPPTAAKKPRRNFRRGGVSRHGSFSPACEINQTAGISRIRVKIIARRKRSSQRRKRQAKAQCQHNGHPANFLIWRRMTSCLCGLLVHAVYAPLDSPVLNFGQ